MAIYLQEDAERELLDKAKAYLECRSRGLAPSTSLVEGWDRFYWSYEPGLRGLLRGWNLSPADREDCLQEVWAEVVAHLGRFRHDPGRGRLSTWLMTVARSKAADVVRRRCRHPSRPLGEGDEAALLDPVPGPEADCERRWVEARVRAALAELAGRVSESSFRVLYLRWIEGCGIAEIAAALELTPGQVRLRAHRMKRRFRDVFERDPVPSRSSPEIDRVP